MKLDVNCSLEIRNLKLLPADDCRPLRLKHRRPELANALSCKTCLLKRDINAQLYCIVLHCDYNFEVEQNGIEIIQ